MATTRRPHPLYTIILRSTCLCASIKALHAFPVDFGQFVKLCDLLRVLGVARFGKLLVLTDIVPCGAVHGDVSRDKGVKDVLVEVGG